MSLPKVVVILVATLLPLLATQAQTIVTFQNQGTGPVGAFLWPIYLPETTDPYLVKHGNTAAGLPAGTQTYNGGPVAGSGYTAQLWVGPAGSPEGALVLAATTTFGTGASAGLLVRVTAAVPGVLPGSAFTWQARAWENRGNTITAWAQALSDPTIIRGKTLLATAASGSSTTYGGQSFNLHREGPPQITVHPQGGFIATGMVARLSVAAVGTPTLRYQWRKNDLNVDPTSRITGATTPALTLSNAITSDSGNYSVVVSNPLGATTSKVAVLTVGIPPAITFPFSLNGPDSVFFHLFNVSTSGTIRVEVTWQGASSNLTVDLAGRRRSGLPDPSAPFATATGKSPLTLSYTVSAADVARGAGWRLVIRDPARIGQATGVVRLTIPFVAELNLALDREKVPLRSGDLLPGPALQARFLTSLAATPATGLHAIISLTRALSCDEDLELERLGLLRQTHLAKPGYHSFGLVRKAINLADPLLRAVLASLTPLEPEDKVEPNILVGNYARFIVRPAPGAVQNYVLNPNGSLQLSVLFAKDVPVDRIQAILRAEAVSFSPLTDNLWRVTLVPGRVRGLGAYDEVEWIEAGPAPTLEENSTTRPIVWVDAVQSATINAGAGTIAYNGLTGAGVTVGVDEDGGLDAAHPDLNIVADAAAVGKHGTHVAGIIAGSGQQSNQNDANGNPNGGTPFQWRGMAPNAALIDSGDLITAANLLAAIQNNSLDLANHSHSITFDGNYDAQNQTTDQEIRGGTTSGGTVVPRRFQAWSAGNHGTIPQNGGNQIGYFALTKQMKNPVIVGNWNSSGGASNLAGSSSMGPAHDGRIKPDVVAPGSSVKSTGTGPLQANPNCVCYCANNSLGYGLCSGTSMATPVVSGIAALLLQAWQNTYSAPLGTTIDATPPLPSTLRALLIQTATDMVGNNIRNAAHPEVDGDSNSANGNDGLGTPSATVGPDYTTGWGLVNAQAAVTVLQDFRTEFGRPVPNRIIQDSVQQADTREYDFVVSQAGPLKVTLAWDDVEAAVQSPATSPLLVNDLDLVLLDPSGTPFYPWQLGQTIQDMAGNPLANDAQTPGTAIQVVVPISPTATPAANNDYIPANALTGNGAWVATTGRDHLNNVEQVFVANVQNAQIGHWKIRVSGFDVRQGPQDFSVTGFPYPALPELVASCSDKIGLPAFGTPVEFTWTVANIGAVATPGPFNYQVWLSRDLFVDAGDVMLVDANQAALAALANASVSKTSSIQISQAQADALLGNPPGTTTVEQLTSADVFLLVQVDSGNTVLEHNEVNVAFVQLARLVDVVLVMDRSGSMNDNVTVSSGTRRKIDLLKDAANLFLDLMRLDAGDELGEVSFSGGVTTDFGPGSVLTPLTAANLNNAKAPITALAPGGATDIRDALQQGMDLITTAANANHRRVIVFLSDGMKTAGGDPTEAGFLSQFAANGITTYSVGFGTLGGSGNAGIDVDLLQTLANANPSEHGFFHVTESAVALDKFFVNAVAGAVRSEVVVDPEGDLPASLSTTVDARLGAKDSFATFILTWDNPAQSLTLSVRSPSGLEVNAGNAARFADRVTRISRPTYQLMTLRFPLTGGPSEEHGGRWRMIIRNPGASTVHYAASVISESTVRARWRQPQPAGGAFRPGNAIPLSVGLTDRGGRPLSRARVTVTPNIPLVGLANLLAGAGITPLELARIPLTRNGEALSPAERLYLALLARGGGGNLLRRADLPSFELTPGQAPGEYAGNFVNTRVVGPYSFVARIEGVTPDCENFQREVTGSVAVSPAPVPGLTGVTVDWNTPTNPTVVVVTVTPVATGGNYVGPGSASTVIITPGGGAVAASGVVDNLDGSYSQSFRITDPGRATFAVSVGGVGLPAAVTDTSLPVPLAVLPNGGPNDLPTPVEVLFAPGAKLSAITAVSLMAGDKPVVLNAIQINPNGPSVRTTVPSGLTPALYTVHVDSALGRSPASSDVTFRVIGRGQSFPGSVDAISADLLSLGTAGTQAEGLAQLGLLARDLRALQPGSVLTEAARQAAFNEVTGLLLRGQGLVPLTQLPAVQSLVNAAKIDARVVAVAPQATDKGSKIHVELGNGVSVTFDSVLAPGQSSARLLPGPKDIPEVNRGSPHVTYDISTTAQLDPNAAIAVQIQYEEGDFPDENRLRLLHREDGVCVDRTAALDTERNLILAKVSHLSEFVIVAPSTLPGLVLRVIGLGQQTGAILQLEGPPGTYEVQRSTDLREWVSLGNASLTSLPVTFTDPTADRKGSRFYRAVAGNQ